MTRKRIYTDPPGDERCEARANVERGEYARCGRRKKVNGLCAQHARLAEARVAKARVILAKSESP